MSETDLLENLTAHFDLVLQVLSLYLTVTSAYLIVAFMAGDRLTNSQAIIISTLYIFIAAITTYSMYAWLGRAFYFSNKLKETGVDMPFYSRDGLEFVLASVLLAGILACLKFMWDVRHPKTE
jgi:hypothetical protein